ncbi:MAG: radical SAM protein [Flavobacteriales bacterium]|nr:radical SAM protein [Flavobacteriales bacterium]
MSGLYFHIPFCKQACTYCDFHFSTDTKRRRRLSMPYHIELQRRAAELGNKGLGSIVSGAAPPACSDDQLSGFLDEVRSLSALASAAEVTIEANPDDITEEVLAQWKGIGITRVSLGTQSFRDDRLKWMGRAHDAQQALRSIDSVSKAGFDSWTIDLIYGLPEMTIAEWDEQLTIALDRGNASFRRTA